MKRKFILIGVAIGTFSFGVVFTRVLYLRMSSASVAPIPVIQLQSQTPCIEAETSREFSRFFSEFRNALKNKDTHRLFMMTQRCNFDWVADVQLPHPLQGKAGFVPSQLEPPFEVQPLIRRAWGQGLEFQSETNFAANADTIFSPSIMQRLLQDHARPSTECEYAVSWRDRVLNHLCFEQAAGNGFKFAGLRIEP